MRSTSLRRILFESKYDISNAMPIFRLIAKVRNVLPFRTAKSTSQRKFSFVELQELAEREDFGDILNAAGVPDTLILEAVPKKWSGGRISTLPSSMMLRSKNTRKIILKNRRQVS